MTQATGRRQCVWSNGVAGNVLVAWRDTQGSWKQFVPRVKPVLCNLTPQSVLEVANYLALEQSKGDNAAPEVRDINVARRAVLWASEQCDWQSLLYQAAVAVHQLPASTVQAAVVPERALQAICRVSPVPCLHVNTAAVAYRADAVSSMSDKVTAAPVRHRGKLTAWSVLDEFMDDVVGPRALAMRTCARVVQIALLDMAHPRRRNPVLFRTQCNAGRDGVAMLPSQVRGRDGERLFISVLSGMLGVAVRSVRDGRVVQRYGYARSPTPTAAANEFFMLSWDRRQAFTAVHVLGPENAEASCAVRVAFLGPDGAVALLRISSQHRRMHTVQHEVELAAPVTLDANLLCLASGTDAATRCVDLLALFHDGGGEATRLSVWRIPRLIQETVLTDAVTLPFQVSSADSRVAEPSALVLRQQDRVCVLFQDAQEHGRIKLVLAVSSLRQPGEAKRISLPVLSHLRPRLLRFLRLTHVMPGVMLAVAASLPPAPETHSWLMDDRSFQVLEHRQYRELEE